MCQKEVLSCKTVFYTNFLGKIVQNNNNNNKTISALLKRYAEMLETDGELSPDIYKHLNSCLLFKKLTYKCPNKIQLLRH